MELFEAKWREIPVAADAVNLEFVREVVGRSRIAGAAIVCRAHNSFSLSDCIKVLPATELT
jgi:hypothetical protein